VARKPDTPCATCGKLLWGGTTSLPAGERTCLACRRGSWVQQCEGCGASEVNYPNRYCSVACATRTRVGLPGGDFVNEEAREEARLERSRRKNRKRRTGLVGLEPDSYTLAEISTRDAGRCGICRRLVGTTHDWPHPKSPSIDHIIPLSEGGDDSRANVQLAHLGCNVKKGVRAVGDQLRLVG
jgi:5-methylcytosine-specific restriction endonuclease McrA